MRVVGTAIGLALGLTVLTAFRVLGGQVPCADVISEINKSIRVSGGLSPEIARVARDLGATPIWVEHCMRVYGRRARRPGVENTEGRESRLEQFESDEPEETAPEDFQEPGDDAQPRRREKPPVIQPTPKPREY